MVHSLYGLWLARNKARDGKAIGPAHEIMNSVFAHMREWREIHPRKTGAPVRLEPQCWEPPDEGWVKVNSDGAVSKCGVKGGGGAVLRDHNGAFLAATCHYYPNIVDPEAIEVLACRRALQLAADINATRVHLELDAQAVVNMLKHSARNLSANGPWIEEVKALLGSFVEYKISWVRRSANIAAHKLAKVGVGDELCKVWLGVPPDFVLSVIADDIPVFEF